MVAALVFASVAAIGSLTPFEPRYVPVSDVFKYIRQAVLFGTLFSPVDWLSNFLLFIPLAFFAMGSINWMDKSVRANVGTIAVLLSALALYSVLLEVSQIWISGRVPSPHDVAAQCFGALSGMFAWVWRGPMIADRIGRFLKPLASQGMRGTVTIGYVIFLVAYSLHPLDLTLHPNELWRKWKAGHIVVLPLTDTVAVSDLAVSCLRQALLYLPIGLLWSRFASQTGKANRAMLAGLTFLPVAIEGMQVFAYSRWASATHALAGLLGILVGRLASLALIRILLRRRASSST